MTDASALLLGITLGLRHATDADHVVVVTALVQREPGVLRAARIAALWAAGHTVTFLGLGLFIVLGGLKVPPGFERTAEMMVAVMLLGLGLVHLARSWEPASVRRLEPNGLGAVHFRFDAGKNVVRVQSRWTRSVSRVRPVLIGLVHGLGGSAGVALLAASTLRSKDVAAAYLALVAAGTVLGMVALTVIRARPIAWTMRRDTRLRQVVVVAASLLSVGLGAGALLEPG